jgi:hypothetical protein
MLLYLMKRSRPDISNYFQDLTKFLLWFELLTMYALKIQTNKALELVFMNI